MHNVNYNYMNIKGLLFFLVISSLNCKAAIVELNQKDSIYYNFMQADTTLYGNSATIEIKSKKFQVGVFGYSEGTVEQSDTKGIVAIYKIDNADKPNFYKKFDPINYALVRNLKYLFIENEVYIISVIKSNKLILEKSNIYDKLTLKESDFLECIYDINCFDKKYLDSMNSTVPYPLLFKKNKLNIIYYTITYCAPCEAHKFEMAKLSTNKTINLNYITEAGVKFDKVYNTSQKYFYDRSKVPNKLGYPTLLLFDGEGKFIRTVSDLSSTVIDNLKRDANIYK